MHMWRVVAKANHHPDWPPQPLAQQPKSRLASDEIVILSFAPDCASPYMEKCRGRECFTLTLDSSQSYLITDHADLGKSRKRFF
jgi:hypothetical protein